MRTAECREAVSTPADADIGDTEVPSQPSIAGGSNAVISGGGGPVVGGESDSNNGETDLGQPPSSRRTTIAGPAACDPPSTGSTVNDVSQYDPRLFDLPQQDQSGMICEAGVPSTVCGADMNSPTSQGSCP